MSYRSLAFGSAIGAAILTTACGSGAGTNEDIPEVEDVGVEKLIVQSSPPVETAGTDFDISDEQAVAPAGYAPPTILGQATPLFATGSEPYWTAQFADGWLMFERPGLPLVEVPIPEFSETDGQASFSAENVEVSLVSGACENAAGPLQVTITFEEVEYFGCAGEANGAENPGLEDISWKDMIAPSVKALDACLDEASGQRRVMALYPREPGTVGMILGDQFGGYEECGADVETGDVLFMDPMSADQAEAWMTGAVFVREGKGAACKTDSEEVGNGLGAFHPKGCR